MKTKLVELRTANLTTAVALNPTIDSYRWCGSHWESLLFFTATALYEYTLNHNMTEDVFLTTEEGYQIFMFHYNETPYLIYTDTNLREFTNCKLNPEDTAYPRLKMLYFKERNPLIPSDAKLRQLAQNAIHKFYADRMSNGVT